MATLPSTAASLRGNTTVTVNPASGMLRTGALTTSGDISNGYITISGTAIRSSSTTVSFGSDTVAGGLFAGNCSGNAESATRCNVGQEDLSTADLPLLFTVTSIPTMVGVIRANDSITANPASGEVKASNFTASGIVAASGLNVSSASYAKLFMTSTGAASGMRKAQIFKDDVGAIAIGHVNEAESGASYPIIMQTDSFTQALQTIYRADTHVFQRGDGTATRMLLTSTGIDITGDAKVSGDTETSGLFLRNLEFDTTGSGSGQWQLEAIGGARNLHFYLSGALKAYITSNGVYNVVSDRALKKDELAIQPTEALSCIRRLIPKTYRMRSTNELGIGFVAQEVEHIIPIAFKPACESCRPGMEDHPCSLDTHGIFVHNVAATQEIANQVDALREENRALRERLDRIESIVLNMEPK